MDEARAKTLTEALSIGADELYSIAFIAARTSQALVGTGSSADKFYAAAYKLTSVEKEIMPVIESISGFDPEPLREHLRTVKSTSWPSAGILARDASRRRIRLICETEVLTQLGNLTTPVQPTSEPVVAAVVFAKAPTYLQRTLLQANGCYVNRWFEASSVMIRKLVENLIIDVYEKHQKQEQITGKDGDYHMLNGLVTAIVGQTHWPLQRETKRALPEIKKLGDRAAHNRRYETTEPDIDNILPGLRATVDDLLHLAGHK